MSFRKALFVSASRPLEHHAAETSLSSAHRTEALHASCVVVMRACAIFLALLVLILVSARAAETQLCFRLEGPTGSDDALRTARPRPRARARPREDDVPDDSVDPDESECVSVDLESVVVASVTETERSGRVPGAVPSETQTRKCACASVQFVCGARRTVSHRTRRLQRARANADGLDDTSHPHPGADDDEDDVSALCGAPCNAERVCPTTEADDTDARACVAPACAVLCASCVPRSRERAGVSLAELRGACGDEHACLCAQCLEEGMLTAPEGDDSAGAEGRFGLSYSQSLYAPGYGGYGPNPYRPGVVPGNTPYGPYPGSYYPGFAVYQPWFVSVYSKAKALVLASLCYWYPFYPACRPPPPRPIRPPRPFPSPPTITPPPPPILGAPPTPGPATCGDPSLGDLTCNGIPCEGESTCTVTEPQCCCDVSCLDFGDCCADRAACCGVLAGGAEGYSAGVDAEASPVLRSETREMFQTILEAGAQRKSGARRRRANGGAAAAERVAVPDPAIRARAAASSAASPSATATRREAPVFEIGGDRASVLDVGGEGEVDDARSLFREYFAAAAPPPETQ